MSPITSTPACCAASTVQCGLGWVSGAPGVSTSAAKFAQDTLRKSAVVNPACAASASFSTPSSLAITSAPPAFRAWQLASPEPPRPNTATVLPAKLVTGITTSFRGAPLRREPGIQRSERVAGFRVRSQGLAPRNDDVDVVPPSASSPQLQRRETGQ